jgi:hypothetical protein
MSEIKVNKISPRTACGTTTLGDSGDTFTIPAGVTITNNGTANGFGATGAVNWQTTVKTSGFTATAGEGYFVNTTGGAISINLPAGTAGAVVGFKDYAKTFDTNAVTLVQNGSDKIGGSTVNATLDTEGIAVTLVFIDSTQGWLVTDSGLQSEAPTAEFLAATGGTITTSGNFKVHAFTGPGTFTVTNAGNAAGSTSVDYLVVAGGGGGGDHRAGGGGAGGLRIGAVTPSPCHSPLVTTGLPVTAQAYPIAVGGGGAGNGSPQGTSGVNSTFSTIASAGGGGGGSGNSNACGATGGSGGGNGVDSGGPARTSGAAGNTPPVSPPQGNPGGGTIPAAGGEGGGGGGGATAAGSPQPQDRTGGPGGAGLSVTSVFGASPQPFYQANVSGTGNTACGSFAGGGGGGGTPSGSHASSGGVGGGAGGSYGTNSIVNATTNSGGGGGGGGCGPVDGTNGGSGIVLIRYKFQ